MLSLFHASRFASIPFFFLYLFGFLYVGLLSVARSGKWDERATGITLYVLYSFPSFVAALMLHRSALGLRRNDLVIVPSVAFHGLSFKRIF